MRIGGFSSLPQSNLAASIFFAFIDNTMIAISRPGDGSITDGEAVSRVLREVQ